MSVQRFHDAFSLDSARRRFLFKDDFLGDQLQDLWTVGGVGTAPVVDAQTGGIVRITTGGVTNNQTNISWNNIRSLLVSKNVCMEFRLKITQLDNFEIRVSLEFDNDNFVRFIYNSGVDGNWHTDTKDGGASTNKDTGVVADTDYHVFRMETFDTPSALFYIDDVLVNTHTTNVPDDAADVLQPIFRALPLEDAVKTADADYVVVSQER